MKIGLVYHQFLHAGGLENYLIEFSRRLVAAGHELHIVTSRIAPEVAQKVTAQWHLIHRAPTAFTRLWWFDVAAARAVGCEPVAPTQPAASLVVVDRPYGGAHGRRS